jgi:hypothetical protein
MTSEMTPKDNDNIRRGDLLIDKRDKDFLIVVLVTEVGDRHTFKGVIVYSMTPDSNAVPGYYTDCWSKSFFEPFQGTIQLKS